MQLQQRCYCIVIILFFSHFTRPEADDIKAMQQQLSSLHLVMEQSSGENEKQLRELGKEKQHMEMDKKR